MLLVIGVLPAHKGIPRSFRKIEMRFTRHMKLAAFRVKQTRRSNAKRAAKRFQEVTGCLSRIGCQ